MESKKCSAYLFGLMPNQRGAILSSQCFEWHDLEHEDPSRTQRRSGRSLQSLGCELVSGIECKLVSVLGSLN